MPLFQSAQQVANAKSLQTFFQPILELDKEVLRLMAFEGFCHGSDAGNPEFGGDHAQDNTILDMAYLGQVLEIAQELPENAFISLNIQKSTLVLQPEFPTHFLDWLAIAGMPPTRFILEVNTQNGPGQGTEHLDVLQNLRSHGVKVALDDVGIGRTNLDQILEIRPDILKLSPMFTQGLLHDPYRQAILEALVDMTRKTGGRILAKNLESVDDFRIARWMGVALFQGYLFAVPGPIALWREHPFPQEWPLRSFMRRPARMAPPLPESISPDRIH